MPKDPRPFITVHDGMPEHPKIESLSDAAFRLLISTWCWCSRNRTDGRVKAASWEKRGTPRSRKELIDARLAEVTADGVQMHDYLDHQRSAAEIDELSRKRSEAGKRGGNAKANALASAKASATANGKQNGGKDVADTDTELARHTSSKTRDARATRISPDWNPSAVAIAWQREQGISDLLARRELPKFRDYWAGRAGEAGRKLDWDATWRNWLRTAQEREPKRNDDDPAGWARG